MFDALVAETHKSLAPQRESVGSQRVMKSDQELIEDLMTGK